MIHFRMGTLFRTVNLVVWKLTKTNRINWQNISSLVHSYTTVHNSTHVNTDDTVVPQLAHINSTEQSSTMWVVCTTTTLHNGCLFAMLLSLSGQSMKSNHFFVCECVWLRIIELFHHINSTARYCDWCPLLSNRRKVTRNNYYKSLEAGIDKLNNVCWRAAEMMTMRLSKVYGFFFF